MRKSTLDPQFSAARMNEKDYRRLTANLRLEDTEKAIQEEQEEHDRKSS
jgi:hypothetical protein